MPLYVICNILRVTLNTDRNLAIYETREMRGTVIERGLFSKTRPRHKSLIMRHISSTKKKDRLIEQKVARKLSGQRPSITDLTYSKLSYRHKLPGRNSRSSIHFKKRETAFSLHKEASINSNNFVCDVSSLHHPHDSLRNLNRESQTANRDPCFSLISGACGYSRV
jgi:hypothetical protein